MTIAQRECGTLVQWFRADEELLADLRSGAAFDARASFQAFGERQFGGRFAGVACCWCLGAILTKPYAIATLIIGSYPIPSLCMLPIPAPRSSLVCHAGCVPVLANFARESDIADEFHYLFMSIQSLPYLLSSCPFLLFLSTIPQMPWFGPLVVRRRM